MDGNLKSKVFAHLRKTYIEFDLPKSFNRIDFTAALNSLLNIRQTSGSISALKKEAKFDADRGNFVAV